MLFYNFFMRNTVAFGVKCEIDTKFYKNNSYPWEFRKSLIFTATDLIKFHKNRSCKKK